MAFIYSLIYIWDTKSMFQVNTQTIIHKFWFSNIMALTVTFKSQMLSIPLNYTSFCNQWCMTNQKWDLNVVLASGYAYTYY